MLLGFGVIPLHGEKSQKNKKIYTDLQTVEAPSNSQQPIMTSSPNFQSNFSYLLSNEHQSTSAYQPSNKLTVVPPIIPDVQVILLISLT